MNASPFSLPDRSWLVWIICARASEVFGLGRPMASSAPLPGFRPDEIQVGRRLADAMIGD